MIRIIILTLLLPMYCYCQTIPPNYKPLLLRVETADIAIGDSLDNGKLKISVDKIGSNYVGKIDYSECDHINSYNHTYKITFDNIHNSFIYLEVKKKGHVTQKGLAYEWFGECNNLKTAYFEIDTDLKTILLAPGEKKEFFGAANVSLSSVFWYPRNFEEYKTNTNKYADYYEPHCVSFTYARHYVPAKSLIAGTYTPPPAPPKKKYIFGGSSFYHVWDGKPICDGVLFHESGIRLSCEFRKGASKVCDNYFCEEGTFDGTTIMDYYQLYIKVENLWKDKAVLFKGFQNFDIEFDDMYEGATECCKDGGDLKRARFKVTQMGANSGMVITDPSFGGYYIKPPRVTSWSIPGYSFDSVANSTYTKNDRIPLGNVAECCDYPDFNAYKKSSKDTSKQSNTAATNNNKNSTNNPSRVEDETKSSNNSFFNYAEDKTIPTDNNSFSTEERTSPCENLKKQILGTYIFKPNSAKNFLFGNYLHSKKEITFKFTSDKIIVTYCQTNGLNSKKKWRKVTDSGNWIYGYPYRGNEICQVVDNVVGWNFRGFIYDPTTKNLVSHHEYVNDTLTRVLTTTSEPTCDDLSENNTTENTTSDDDLFTIDDPDLSYKTNAPEIKPQSSDNNSYNDFRQGLKLGNQFNSLLNNNNSVGSQSSSKGCPEAQAYSDKMKASENWTSDELARNNCPQTWAQLANWHLYKCTLDKGMETKESAEKLKNFLNETRDMIIRDFGTKCGTVPVVTNYPYRKESSSSNSGNLSSSSEKGKLLNSDVQSLIDQIANETNNPDFKQFSKDLKNISNAFDDMYQMDVMFGKAGPEDLEFYNQAESIAQAVAAGVLVYNLFKKDEPVYTPEQEAAFNAIRNLTRNTKYIYDEVRFIPHFYEFDQSVIDRLLKKQQLFETYQRATAPQRALYFTHLHTNPAMTIQQMQSEYKRLKAKSPEELIQICADYQSRTTGLHNIKHLTNNDFALKDEHFKLKYTLAKAYDATGQNDKAEAVRATINYEEASPTVVVQGIQEGIQEQDNALVIRSYEVLKKYLEKKGVWSRYTEFNSLRYEEVYGVTGLELSDAMYLVSLGAIAYIRDGQYLQAEAELNFLADFINRTNSWYLREKDKKVKKRDVLSQSELLKAILFAYDQGMIYEKSTRAYLNSVLQKEGGGLELIQEAKAIVPRSSGFVSLLAFDPDKNLDYLKFKIELNNERYDEALATSRVVRDGCYLATKDQIRFEKVTLNYKRKRYDLAKAGLEVLMSKHGERPKYLILYARVLEKLGMESESKKFYLKYENNVGK